MSKRSITIAFEFDADADPEHVNNMLELAVQEVNSTVKALTAEEVEKWGKWQGLKDHAYPVNVLVTRQQTLSERLAMARVLAGEPPLTETFYDSPEAAAAAATL